VSAAAADDVRKVLLRMKIPSVEKTEKGSIDNQSGVRRKIPGLPTMKGSVSVSG
jgi:hypothetical protein